MLISDWVLTYDQLIPIVKTNKTLIDDIYHDINQTNRFCFGGDSKKWFSIGAKLDELHGGDWMPMSQISKLILLEEVL